MDQATTKPLSGAGDGRGLAALRHALRAGAGEAALALFRAALAGAASAPDTLFRAWVEQGWMSFARGSGRHGLDREWLAARQDEAAAALLFARIAFGSGHGPVAVATVRRTMDRHPGQPGPCFRLCAMLLLQGDPDAQRLLQRCLDRFPPPSDGWSEVGDVLLALGKNEAALVCFARGLPDAETALQRGRAARNLGRREEARRWFGEAARLDERSSRAWFLLGTAAQDLHDLPGAIEAYRKVLMLDPTLAEAAVNLGTVLQEAGDLDGARAAYGQAVVTRADTFGRVSQALATSRKGELWLDLGALRRSLVG